MTHSLERSHWIKEGCIGLGTGAVYGLTSIIVGHPFDTVKTKMQAQIGFEKTSMVRTFAKTIKTQGFIGLYRGCLPPLVGSGLYRSLQFAGFESVYTFFDSYPLAKLEIPYSGGLQLRVLAGGIAGATLRAVTECPLEYAKVRRQVNRNWHYKDVFTGLQITWLRTVPLFTIFICLVDSGRRNFPEVFNKPILGPFLTSGVAATLAWWIVWPLEVMKSQVQGQYGDNMSTWARLRTVYMSRGGFFGLYRGLLPGTIRSFAANGFAMIAMQLAQRKVTEWGVRDSRY